MDRVSYTSGCGESVYLYNNNSTDNYQEILKPYIDNGIVILTEWPKKHGQRSAYNNCIKRFRYNSYWMAFIDIDEFLFGTHEDNLCTILKDYEAYPGVQVNWLVFGSSGNMTRPPGLVIENYTWRADYLVKNGDIGTWPSALVGSGFVTKSIVRMDVVVESFNPHIFFYNHDVLSVNEHFEFQAKICTMYLSVDRIRINHYFTKSYAEMQNRILKGSATGRKKNTRLMEGIDRNDIQDLTIQRFTSKLTL